MASDGLTQMTSTPGGEALRRAREGKMSREDLAGLVGRTSSAIYKIESGEIRNPNRDTVAAIDEALDAHGSILAAFGFSPPVDLVALVEKSRQEVAQLRTEVEQLAEAVELLQLFRAAQERDEHGEGGSAEAR